MSEEPAEVEESDDSPLDNWIAATIGTPVRWVLVCEYLDDDGGRDVAVRTNENCYLWDIQGLLHYAIQTADQQTWETSIFAIGDEDEDEQ